MRYTPRPLWRRGPRLARLRGSPQEPVDPEAVGASRFGDPSPAANWRPPRSAGGGTRARIPRMPPIARELLGGAWQAKGPEKALDSAPRVGARKAGQRAEFNQVWKNGLPPAWSPGPNPDRRRKFEIAKSYHPKFGRQSIFAWDYMRYISRSCRLGLPLAGFLSEQEGVGPDHGPPPGSSQQTLLLLAGDGGRNFILGRGFWDSRPEPQAPRRPNTPFFSTPHPVPKPPGDRYPWKPGPRAAGPSGGPLPRQDRPPAWTWCPRRPRGPGPVLLLGVVDRPPTSAPLVSPRWSRALGCKLRVPRRKKAQGPAIWRLAARVHPESRKGPQREVGHAVSAWTTSRGRTADKNRRTWDCCSRSPGPQWP